MTAIFAFVEGLHAFVACDTQRGQDGLSQVATKVQRWSSNILVAQTGTGGTLQKLFGEMFARQHLQPQPNTTAAIINLYTRMRPYILEHDIYHHHGGNRNVVSGRLIVVEVPELIGSGPPTMTVLELMSHTVTPLSSHIHADGSDPAGFLQIAQAEYARLRPSGQGPFDAGTWGYNCVDAAIRSAGGAGKVNWPMDLAVIKPEGRSLICITKRIGHGGSPGPHFML